MKVLKTKLLYILSQVYNTIIFYTCNLTYIFINKKFQQINADTDDASIASVMFSHGFAPNS